VYIGNMAYFTPERIALINKILTFWEKKEAKKLAEKYEVPFLGDSNQSFRAFEKGRTPGFQQ